MTALAERPIETTAPPQTSGAVRFGPEILGDLDLAETREWLVTNGIGGYASGTVAGSLSRGYHGLLVAAVHPPTDRRLVLAKLQERVTCGTTSLDLTTDRWAGGTVAPAGHRFAEHFELEGSVPCWRHRNGDVVVDRRIWMEHGENTVFVAWTVVQAPGPVRLQVEPIVDDRSFHDTGATGWPPAVTALPDGLQIAAAATDHGPLVVRLPGRTPEVTADLVGYRDFELRRETSRGLRDTDDHVHAGFIELDASPGETIVLMASVEARPADVEGALQRRRARDRSLLDRWPAPMPAWVAQLVLAADQFVVARQAPGEPDGRSVIAGYHWFGDWGRDTMISLPGLTLATGRAEDAAPVLRTFARYVNRGMLPNRFPDAGDTPEYNTVDATLWYVHAVRAYYETTGDRALLAELFDVLADIVEQHVAGTRYGIGVDPADGLLRWSAPGMQLTWMDARVGDHVITPRQGKPVEVNALWYGALVAMTGFATDLGRPADRYRRLAETARHGFDRFWNPATGHLFDVLDGPDGDDPTLRPNQLLAASLPASPLDDDRARAVLDACTRALLTPHGLRSLDPADPAYVGSYAGDQAHRDGCYHQGTVWGWLIGPYVDTCLRLGETDAAERALEPWADHLRTAGLGTVAEIFDGDPPHAPRGCIAQAWSVAEVLRAWHRLSGGTR